jgi:uncharacterized protein
VRAFVDTSAFIALIDADDPQHGAVLDVWRDGLQSGATFISTNYVALETAAALQRRFGLETLMRFVADMLPAVSLEWVAPEDHDAGLALLLVERRRKLSWVDCVSFVVMRRLRVDAAFALDPHFGGQGFTLLPKR